MINTLKYSNQSTFNTPKNEPQIISVYIRNYAKIAIKISVPQSITYKQLIQKTSQKIKISSENMLLFSEGKLLGCDESLFHNGSILYAINKRRVNLSQIEVRIKRISGNTQLHKFFVCSQMKIECFMKEYLRDKYGDTSSYFLVYIGRELCLSKSFQEEFFESESEILLVHKIEDLKSQEIQVTASNQSNQKQAIPLQNINFPKTVVQEPQSPQALQGKRILENKEPEIKVDKKYETSFSYEEENSMPSELYETAKFNSPEEILNYMAFRKLNCSMGSNGNRKEEEQLSVHVVQEDEEEDGDDEIEEIIIGYTNAYSNMPQMKVGKNVNENKEEIGKVYTRYGCAPKKSQSDINRYDNEENIGSDLETSGILVLNPDMNILIPRSTSSSKDKEKSPRDEESPREEAENISEFSKIEIDKDSSKISAENPIQQIEPNPLLLATISSRHDEEEMYAMDSLRFSHKYNTKSLHVKNNETLPNIESCTSLQSAKFEGSSENPFRNINLINSLTSSVELSGNETEFELKNYEEIQNGVSLNMKKDAHKINMLEAEVPLKEQEMNSDQEKNEPEELDEKENHFESLDSNMKKRENRVLVKNMIQTVSPSFYKASVENKEEEKAPNTSRSEARKKNNDYDQVSSSSEDEIVETDYRFYKQLNENKEEESYVNVSPNQNKNEKNQWMTVKRTFSEDYEIDSQGQIINGENCMKTKENKSNDEITENNSSAVEFYVPMVGLPFIKGIKLPQEVDFKDNQHKENTENKEMTQSQMNDIKDRVLHNVSKVSSTYHQVTNSEYSSTFQHMPHPVNQMKDSYISNFDQSENENKLWGNRSNRFSIGSIESETVYPADMIENSEREIEEGVGLHEIAEENSELVKEYGSKIELNDIEEVDFGNKGENSMRKKKGFQNLDSSRNGLNQEKVLKEEEVSVKEKDEEKLSEIKDDSGDRSESLLLETSQLSVKKMMETEKVDKRQEEEGIEKENILECYLPEEKRPTSEDFDDKFEEDRFLEMLGVDFSGANKMCDIVEGDLIGIKCEYLIEKEEARQRVPFCDLIRSNVYEQFLQIKKSNGRQIEEEHANEQTRGPFNKREDEDLLADYLN